MDSDKKLEICKQTRKIAENAFEKAFAKIVASTSKISEKDFADIWLSELGKSSKIFPNGWYQPPPRGIGVLFATDNAPERVTFPTLRDKTYWPRDNVFLDRKNGLIVVYFSAVDKDTGIIGDFGKTIYLGKNQKLQSHIGKCHKMISSVFDLAQSGMTLCELYQKASELFEKNNLKNDWWISINDPTNINMGHTVPFAHENFKREDKKILKSNDWQAVCNFISRKRIFFNSQSSDKIEPPFALTIEPRLIDKTDKKLPPIFFHTIALFYANGTKEHLKPYLC